MDVVGRDVKRKNDILILPALLRVSDESALFIVLRAAMLYPTSEVCFFILDSNNYPKLFYLQETR